jgi:hypothetical protein
VLDGAPTAADWEDVRRRAAGDGRPIRRWLALAVAAALVAVAAASAVAGNVFDLFRDTTRPALPRTAFEPRWRAELDARYGDWSIREVGNDGKTAFYAMKDGGGRVVCIGSGPAKPKPSQGPIGSLSCPQAEYLTHERPLYYEVAAEATRKEPIPHPWRVKGVAIDGVEQVAVANADGQRTLADVHDHVFTLTKFPSGQVFRIEAIDGKGNVVSAEDLEGFGPGAPPHRPLPAPGPQPRSEPPFPALPSGSPVQRGHAGNARLSVYRNGLVSIRVGPRSDQARVVWRPTASIVCYRQVVLDGVRHIWGTGATTSRSGLELRARLTNRPATVTTGGFEGCGVSTLAGRRWNDPRSMHLPIEIALSSRGRRFFGEQAAAHDLAFFVRSKHIKAFRRALTRDPAARLPRARAIVAGLPDRVVALSSPADPLRAGQIGVWSHGRKLVLATKAADGRRFSVVLQDGRVVQQHLGGLTSAF